jgi:hypothetical protein
MMRTLGAVLLALLLGPHALAKDMASLYDDATLAYWQQHYQEGVRWNVENVIWPRLTADERQRLAGLSLCFPLRGHSNPLLRLAAARAPARLMLMAKTSQCRGSQATARRRQSTRR